MNIATISMILLSGIDKELKEYDFKFNKRDKLFWREENECLQIFSFLFLKKNDGIYVEPILRVKLKSIEDIYHSVAIKEKKYFVATSTLSISLFKVFEYIDNGIDIDIDEKKRYLIEEEKDIEILINVIVEKFRKYALPYFENNTIDKIDKLLNKHPKEISIHNWLYPLRACLALIAAKLNDNPNYDTLVVTYTQEMKGAVEPYKTEFSELLEKLSKLK